MVQRKAPSKRGIQADHAKSDKSLANLKLRSSQHQDGKSRGSDWKKKMKKSRSIKLSDLVALQSPPSRKSLSKPVKAPPPRVPATAPSPQKQKRPLVITTDGSPNYMKPTSSSDAKKEIFPVSLRNTQSGSDGKKASTVSSKKPAKTLTRSSSLNLVRTLTKTPSFKPSRACPRKSTKAVLCADMNAPERATCSSTLKDSKFPQYLMLNPGCTESEGASVMKVCPYKYCSLNYQRPAPLPPLKSFVSARGHVLKTQKSMKLEAVSPQRLKVPCETKKESDIGQNVFDGKPAYDEADTVNPIITPLAKEIGTDFFIEIYGKERKGADKMGKFDCGKDLEDEEDMKSTIEENGIAAGEDDVKQVTPSMTHALPKSEIDLEKDFKSYFDDDAIEADPNGSFHQQQNAEDADENHPPIWFHEDVCMGSYCSEVNYDEEHAENIELDYSDSEYTDMECEEEEQYCALGHEEDIDFSVFREEETDSKFESLSESSDDVTVMSLYDILGSHYADILVEEAIQEANEEESTCSEAQPHGTNSVLEGTSESIELETQETDYMSNGISCTCDQSSLTEKVFRHLTNAEDNDRENEKHVDDEASCATKVLDEEMVENSEGHKMSEACEIDESHKDSNSSLDNTDESISQEHQSTIVVQEQQLLDDDQVQANKFQSKSFIGEEENASKYWQWATRRKRTVQDDEEMRKINPRKPNFLPLVPDPVPEKVNLNHQMMDERKNAEEWMLDFALRQAVTKLAPAGKRKVALLVEAFERVISIPTCETHLRNNSSFAHARPIQACS